MPSDEIYENKSDFNIRFFYGNTVCYSVTPADTRIISTHKVREKVFA